MSETARELPENNHYEEATFGAGCFWCTEAVYLHLAGVIDAVPGYSGGRLRRPTYEDVYSGTTGHAEVARVTFDPAVISYEELLEVFWKIHDPTLLNRQNDEDVGTHYRSVIFYHNDDQKNIAEGCLKKLEDSGAFDKPLVTEISQLGEFYVAEDYHKNYFAIKGDENSYCQRIVRPKIEKFKFVFQHKLKAE